MFPQNSLLHSGVVTENKYKSALPVRPLYSANAIIPHTKTYTANYIYFHVTVFLRQATYCLRFCIIL
jgi:hypothetical protein